MQRSQTYIPLTGQKKPTRAHHTQTQTQIQAITEI